MIDLTNELTSRRGLEKILKTLRERRQTKTLNSERKSKIYSRTGANCLERKLIIKGLRFSKANLNSDSANKSAEKVRSVSEQVEEVLDSTALTAIHRLTQKYERLVVQVNAHQSLLDAMALRLTQNSRDADLEAVKRGEQPGFPGISIWEDGK